MNSIAGLQQIFPSIKEDSDIEHLGKITGEHPYFSIAQLYLLHHAKNNLSLSEKQAAKTALFFNNIPWLNWQLNTVSLESQPEKIEEDHPGEVLTENYTETGKEDPLTKVPLDFIAGSNEDTMVFEPLHTTDYFASQGIKITEEPIANDKLGTQMKSFTEWLKSMKKVHGEKLPAADEQTDRKIQNIAEDSNLSTDIVTEAMAEVLVKQNKIEKAIEMYRELSLINPLKSAYFAAKIESLSIGR